MCSRLKECMKHAPSRIFDIQAPSKQQNNPSNSKLKKPANDERMWVRGNENVLKLAKFMGQANLTPDMRCHSEPTCIHLLCSYSYP